MVSQLKRFVLIRLLCALLLSVLYVIALALAKPFKRLSLNILAVTMQLVIIIIFIGTICIHIFDEWVDRADGAVATQVMGFTSGREIATMVIICNLVLLPAPFLGLCVYKAVRMETIQTLRLSGMNELPELALDKGCFFHLFLSHVWSSGQDQASAIKRKMQLLVPSVRVFLDVDDLDDISNLEEHIKESQCCLIFLSRGYFSSANCMREVAASVAVEHQRHAAKPLVLVHEADPLHGGTPLSVLHDECPDSVRKEIFEARSVTTWHRLAAFQLVVFQRITAGMLHASPSFKHTQEPPLLVVANQLDQQVLGLREEMHLYVSPSNAGAAELLTEVQTRYKRVSDKLVVVADISSRGTQAGRWSLPILPSASNLVPLTPKRQSMLIYLCKQTFEGEAGRKLASEVRMAMGNGWRIILVHERDDARDGTPFEHFFKTTPNDLILGGLYKKLAVPLEVDPFRAVSIALVAKALGAVHSSPVWRKVASTTKMIVTEVTKTASCRGTSRKAHGSVQSIKDSETCSATPSVHASVPKMTTTKL